MYVVESVFSSTGRRTFSSLLKLAITTDIFHHIFLRLWGKHLYLVGIEYVIRKKLPFERTRTGAIHVIKNYPTDAKKSFTDMLFGTSYFFMYLYGKQTCQNW